MIETIMSIMEGANLVNDSYKLIHDLVFGNKQEEYLEQIASDTKDMKIHIERLSDHILYAANMDSVRAAEANKTKYVEDLKQVRDILLPLQQAFDEPILSSAVIVSPQEIKHPRSALEMISELRYLITPEPIYEGEIPVIFVENGIYYVGWQQTSVLSQRLACETFLNWQVNKNVLPESNPVDIKTLVPPFEKWGLGGIFRDSLKDGNKGPEMLWIPAGKFNMGSDQYDDEKPIHEVSVEKFAMGIYPVTVAEFKQFVNATKYKTEAEKGDGAWIWKKNPVWKIWKKKNDREWKKVKDANWRNPYFSQQDNHPVVCVSWNDAVAYTKWLSEQTGKEYRLPTEAEWEYAARAGTETDCWWGDEIDKSKANYDGNLGNTSPVGDYDANPFGLYDTAGNVWEWTCSEYEEKYNGKEKECVIENSNKKRVLRGGSWYYSPRSVRTAFRNWDTPDSRHDDNGFRVVVMAAAWT